MVQKGLMVFTFLLAGVYIAGGASFVIGYATESLDWDASGFETVYFGAIPFIAAAMVLSGIFLCERCLRLGPALVIVGAVAMAALWFWVFFILVPAGVVVVAFAVVRARNFARASAI